MNNAHLDRAAEILSQDPRASLTQVAARLGVGRATIYRHFETREGLTRAIALRCLEAMEESLAGLESEVQSATEYLERMFLALVPLGPRYQFLINDGNAFLDEEVAKVVDRQRSEMNELVEELKREGTCAPDLPTAWVVALIDSVLFTAWTTVHEGSVARNDAAGLAMRSVLRGIRSDESANPIANAS